MLCIYCLCLSLPSVFTAWVLMCLNRTCFKEKAVGQTPHLNGFVPRSAWWWFLWRVTFTFVAEAKGQRSHWNGFSPLCVILCLSKMSLRANDIGQNLHWKGFSPVWLLLCLIKLLFPANDIGQRSHANLFSFCLWYTLSFSGKFFPKRAKNDVFFIK